MKIGILLKRYRLIGDISQTALAKELGLTKSTLCRLERGESCGDETLAKVLIWIMSN